VLLRSTIGSCGSCGTTTQQTATEMARAGRHLIIGPWRQAACKLNTGDPFAKSADMRRATQTVQLGSECPSRVVLPIFPR